AVLLGFLETLALVIALAPDQAGRSGRKAGKKRCHGAPRLFRSILPEISGGKRIQQPDVARRTASGIGADESLKDGQRFGKGSLLHKSQTEVEQHAAIARLQLEGAK